jgi:predicted TIM-barrel fold metal-dependent hydrolase
MIDIHSHVWEYPGHIGQHFADDCHAAWGDRVPPGTTLAAHWEAMQPVRRAVVFGLQARASDIWVPNEYVAGYVAQHPDKLIGFASVDPSDEGAPAELERAVRELGLRGLKLGPIYQHVDPNGERCAAVLRVAQRLHLPVIWHQGTTFVRNAPLKYARPFLLDEVAATFPDLTIVVAHLGHPWIDEAIAVARKHTRIFLDVSALASRPWQCYNGLICAQEYGIGHKLLFGSDFPFFTPRQTADALRALAGQSAPPPLPRLEADWVEALIERDSLALVGLE